MRLAAMLFPLALACGATTSPTDQPDRSLIEEADFDDGEPTKSRPLVSPADEAPASTELFRADLDRVLDAGPGAFLARVEVRPHFKGKRFSGWELVSFAQPQSRLAASGLEPGDVVTRINELRLERPENLQKLWSNLRTAPAIVVSGHRSGQPFELRFEVAGPALGPKAAVR